MCLAGKLTVVTKQVKLFLSFIDILFSLYTDYDPLSFDTLSYKMIRVFIVFSSFY